MKTNQNKWYNYYFQGKQSLTHQTDDGQNSTAVFIKKLLNC